MKSYENPLICIDHKEFMKQPFRLYVAQPDAARFIHNNKSNVFFGGVYTGREFPSQIKNIMRRLTW